MQRSQGGTFQSRVDANAECYELFCNKIIPHFPKESYIPIVLLLAKETKDFHQQPT
jgi:hypothetical protein